MVAREMIEGRHFYRGQHLERWAFEITDDAGRRVATVPFVDLPKSKSFMSGTVSTLGPLSLL